MREDDKRGRGGKAVAGVNATQTRHASYFVNENNAGGPIRHPQVAEVFVQDDSGGYRPRNSQLN